MSLICSKEVRFYDFESQPAKYGPAFTREGNLVRKSTAYKQEKAEAALSHIGFAGCAIQASSAYWSVSVNPKLT
jgi:hypothetical protein